MRWAELNSTETRFALTWFSRCSSQLQYKTLEDKLRGVEEDLRQSTSKFSELQRTLESERQVWVSDKKTLEDTIVDLSTSEKTSETDRSARESEVRQQEQRALVKLTMFLLDIRILTLSLQAAEERYSREVLIHAESIKTIETLKQQLTTSQATARENLSEAANAQAKLEASEGSWKQQKEALDKEITDLSARWVLILDAG